MLENLLQLVGSLSSNVKIGIEEMTFSLENFKVFCVCCLSAPRSTMGHYRAFSLVTMYYQFSTQTSHGASKWGWVCKPGRGPSEVWTCSLLIRFQSLKPLTINVLIIQKPVSWFAVQIKWLVSKWWVHWWLKG